MGVSVYGWVACKSVLPATLVGRPRACCLSLTSLDTSSSLETYVHALLLLRGRSTASTPHTRHAILLLLLLLLILSDWDCAALACEGVVWGLDVRREPHAVVHRRLKIERESWGLSVHDRPRRARSIE